MRKQHNNTVNEGAFPLALRQMQEDFRKPLLWIALVCTAVVLALAGAFDTGRAMGTLARIGYWVVVVVLTYGAGNLVTALCRVWFAGLARPLRLGLTALLASLPIIAILVGLNIALFGSIFGDLAGWLRFAATIFVVVLVVTIALDLGFEALATATDGETRGNQTPPLLDRIAFEKRGPLVALSVEDHYVRIRTTKGEEMVLMRLSDAIRETAPEDGLQVHRSHWVALSAVHGAKRTGSTAVLSLSHGPDIPVSRANVAKIKEAGLLV